MKLISLLAGYVAGIAVTMKYRKDKGTSKMNASKADTSKFNTFVDEVVDIHKTAFADVKGFVKANFDDVENFDDLQSKVSEMVSDFGKNLETHLENAKKTGISKKEELLEMAEAFLENQESTLEQAKSKAASFVGVPEETIDLWLHQAKTEITNVYQKIQAKFENEVASEVPKKAPVKKTTPKKTPEKKSE